MSDIAFEPIEETPAQKINFEPVIDFQPDPPANVALPLVTMEKPVGQAEGVLNAFKRGVIAAQRNFDVLAAKGDKSDQPSDRQRWQAYNLAQRDPMYAQKLIEATGDGMSLKSDPQGDLAAMSQVEMTRGPRAKLEQLLRPSVTAKEAREFDIAEASRRMEAIPRSEAMKRWDAAGNEDWYKVLARDPVEIIANITAESLPQSAAGVVMGAAGGSRFGPAGTAAGIGAGSLMTEYASSLVEGAQQAGYDFKKEEDVRKFFTDEKAVEKASLFALKRGVPIAALDAVSAGVAGRFLAPTIGKGVSKVAVGTGKELATQMAAGATGEALAQTTSGQKLSVKEIAAEAIGELGGAPAEVATNIRGELRKGQEAKAADVAGTRGDLNLAADPEEKIDFEPIDENAGEVRMVAPVSDEPETVTQMEPGRYPVLEVPLKDLFLSQDVPNFKGDADPETGVVQGQKLEGKYERLGTGAITVWERNSGRREVISGRHRFDLAKRAGEETIPAQIVRERDGFTRAMAMTLDAEMNIRDGQGTVGDYANYFRNSDVTEAQAKERGLLSRTKGKDGWTLGKLAGNDLYSLYRADKISEAQAVAIAKAAPGEEALQRVGSKQALKGMNAVELVNFVQAVRLRTKAMPMEQLDLFGMDDAAMNEAARMAKTATRYQRELQKEIRATDNAARHAEMARSKGLEFKRSPEELQRENVELALEMRRWDNWALHPDLVMKVMEGGDGKFSIASPGGSGRLPGDEAQQTDPRRAQDALRRTVSSRFGNDVGRALQLTEPDLSDANTAERIGLNTEAKEALEGTLGVKIFFFSDPKRMLPVYGVKLGEIPQAVFINDETHPAALTVVGHEFVHDLEANRPDLYDEMLTKLEPLMSGFWDYKSRLDMTYFINGQKPLNEAAGREELVAEFVAENFGKPEFWQALSRREPALFKKLVAAVKTFLDRVSSKLRSLLQADDRAGRYFSDIEQAREVVADAIARYVREGGRPPNAPATGKDAKFSMRERRFPRQVDASSDISNEVRRGVSNRAYEKRSNETDAAFAKRLVDEAGGPVEAVAMYDALAENQPGAIRGMLASVIIKGLAGMEQLAAMEGKAAESSRLAGLQAEFINRFSEQTTDAGQFIQSLAAFASMTPQGHLSNYRRLIDGAEQKRLDAWTPVINSVQGVLEKANKGVLTELSSSKVAQEATQAAVDAGVMANEDLRRIITLLAGDEVTQLPEVQAQLREAIRKLLLPKVAQTKKSSLWGQYKKGAIGSLVNAVEKAIEGRPAGGKTMLGEFTGTLTAVLREQLNTKLDLQDNKGKPLPPATYFEKLMNGLNNPEKYREVWAAAVEKLQKQYPDNPNVRKLNPNQPQLFSEDIIRGVINEELKDLDVSLREMVAGHYRAANDGRTLRDKIMERTGVQGDQALQLARMIDRVFAERTAKIRNDIDNRVKKIRSDSRLMRLVRSGQVDIAQLPLDDTGKEIARVMRQQMVDINKAIRRHYTVVDETGRSLAEKLAQEAKLPADQAEKFAKVLEARFKALATERKQKELAKLLGAKTKLQLASRPGLEKKLIEMSNLGALDEQKYYEAVAEKLDLPVYREDVAKEIVKQANALQTLPEGSIQQQRAVLDLMSYIAKQRGFKWWELPVAFWYANVLSGPTTQIVNAISNFNNLAANIGMQIVRRPQDTFQILDALGDGFQKGKLDAVDVLKTGQITGTRLLKMEAGRPLELKRFTGWAKFLNAWKYVARVMAAADMLFYKPAEEMKAYTAAKLAAEQEGLKGDAIKKRVREVLQKLPEQRLQAEAQATAEGLAGDEHARRVEQILELGRPDNLRETARDYALRVTFNNQPYGFLGAGANAINTWSAEFPLLRLIVPFTNIVSNVTNEGLNYFPPVGLGRALYGHWSGTLRGQPITDPDALYEQYAKAVAGTMAMTAAALLFAPDPEDDDPELALYGAGPGTGDQRKQLQAAGWRPYTIKVGDRYYSYAQTPVALPFAVMGNYFDALRYKRLDEQDALNRAGYALSVSGKVITEQSFLSGVADLFAGLGRSSAKSSGDAMANWSARTGSSVAIPNAVRQVDRLFDPTVYDAPTVEAALINQVPFLRSVNQPALNALGEPITNEVFSRFISGEIADPVWQIVARKGAWISMPDQGELTDAQYYGMLKIRGERLRQRLEALVPTLERMAPEDAKELVSEISEQETKAAKKRVKNR